MNTIKYEDLVTPELLQGNLDHNVHTGFLEDYRALHCLLRMYAPSSIFEIGTNIGSGINVMAAALPTATIYSLDLDYETMMHNSKQYPIGPNGEDRVGSAARFPYIQLRGDSLNFDYSRFRCDAAFVDGEHDFEHPYCEARALIRNETKLIIFHDADIIEVNQAIIAAFTGEPYEVTRVEGTRIAYATLHQA